MTEVSLKVRTQQTVAGDALFSNGVHVSPQRKKQSVFCKSLKETSNQKQLETLDTYFGKLKQNNYMHPSPSSSSNKEGFVNRIGQSGANGSMGSLDQEYPWKVIEDVKSDKYMASGSEAQASTDAPYFLGGGSGSRQWKRLKSYTKLNYKDAETISSSSQNEISGLYSISILVSLNIAVFLFELASPIQNSELELFSLPSLYGAKINHLILLGEWWRLLTPMFLHSGIFHIALGCWVLLTFGPRVCKAYGSFTFFLIYILGGVSGNLISFLHTAEPTVGGTGPVFAVIGAWLVYQVQNKDVMGKPEFEDMFQKAIVATAFSFVLSNFGPIDDWTHVGAAFTGVVYGFLTRPVFQTEDRSSESGREEGIALVRQHFDPCNSLFVFSIVVLVLSSLMFIFEPPLDSIILGSLL